MKRNKITSLVQSIKAGHVPFTEEASDEVMEAFLYSYKFTKALETVGMHGLPDPGNEVADAPGILKGWLVEAMQEADRLNGAPIRAAEECAVLLDEAAGGE